MSWFGCGRGILKGDFIGDWAVCGLQVGVVAVVVVVVVVVGGQKRLVFVGWKDDSERKGRTVEDTPKVPT